MKTQKYKHQKRIKTTCTSQISREVGMIETAYADGYRNALLQNSKSEKVKTQPTYAIYLAYIQKNYPNNPRAILILLHFLLRLQK